jgi:hypothetical protein
MIVEKTKQMKVKSHSNLQETTAADDRARTTTITVRVNHSPSWEISTLQLKYPKKLFYLFGLAPAGLGPPVLLGNETGVQLRLLGLHQLGQSPTCEKKYLFIKKKIK